MEQRVLAKLCQSCNSLSAEDSPSAGVAATTQPSSATSVYPASIPSFLPSFLPSFIALYFTSPLSLDFCYLDYRLLSNQDVKMFLT
jgi:hypothetical protein